jgi:hypothetical protein
MVNANALAARTEQILNLGRAAILRDRRLQGLRAGSIKDTRFIAEILAKLELNNEAYEAGR